MKHFDIFIIGAGGAGMSAAKAAWDAGCRSIGIADRKPSMGGILQQCIHNGFGSKQTGIDYAESLRAQFPSGIAFFPNTTVLSISENRKAVLSGSGIGLEEVSYDQLILASGCREIPLGALPVSGTRPVTSYQDRKHLRGIFTAGQMQELMNIHQALPDGPAVILGSGDIGLVMAWQLALAGIPVAALVEQKEHCGGMLRNRQRIASYDIPLICKETVTEIAGYPELQGIYLKSGTYIPCKTLLIAAGLLPDRELIRNLRTCDWIHLCGNCRQIHPMIEGVIADGTRAGMEAFHQL